MKGMKTETVLSGMRPTGKLHLGNYFGALKNWLDLQEKYPSYFMIADWHALTSDYADTRGIEANVWEMVIDWLSAGLDPEKCVIFRQSWVREHAELQLILSMMTPLSWLERVPTYKEQLNEVKNKDLSTFGFLGYPVLQAADILLYRAARVPVGEDQLPHIELTREIARRFNHFYGPVFPEPQGMLSRASRLPGTDGRKMSKSYNNALLLSDSPKEIDAKIKVMYTDPKKIHLGDKGHPDGCVVYAHHVLYTPEEKKISTDCKAGTLGCGDCKKRLMATLNENLEPFRQNRARWVSRKNDVVEIVKMGSKKAEAIAAETLQRVRKAMAIAPMPGDHA